MPTSTLLLEAWSAKQVLLALEAGGVALWTWNVDTDRCRHAFANIGYGAA